MRFAAARRARFVCESEDASAPPAPLLPPPLPPGALPLPLLPPPPLVVCSALLLVLRVNMNELSRLLLLWDRLGAPEVGPLAVSPAPLLLPVVPPPTRWGEEPPLPPAVSPPTAAASACNFNNERRYSTPVSRNAPPPPVDAAPPAVAEPDDDAAPDSPMRPETLVDRPVSPSVGRAVACPSDSATAGVDAPPAVELFAPPAVAMGDEVGEGAIPEEHR